MHTATCNSSNRITLALLATMQATKRLTLSFTAETLNHVNVMDGGDCVSSWLSDLRVSEVGGQTAELLLQWSYLLQHVCILQVGSDPCSQGGGCL